jgi:hypothetical protein
MNGISGKLFRITWEVCLSIKEYIGSRGAKSNGPP